MSNATIRDYPCHNALTRNMCHTLRRKSQISRESLRLSVLHHKSLAITSGFVSHNVCWPKNTVTTASHHMSIISRRASRQGRQSQSNFNEFALWMHRRRKKDRRHLVNLLRGKRFTERLEMCPSTSLMTTVHERDYHG